MTGLEALVGRSSIRLVEWRDDATAVRGVDSRSVYAERFWLPILGPSALWLLRYFAWRLDGAPQAVDLCLVEAARSVGLGDRLGGQAPFFRTIRRTVDFAMVRVETDDTIASRRRLPLLSSRQLSRLPDALRHSHGRCALEASFSESPLPS